MELRNRDLFVAGRAVVELKTVKTLEPIHFSIVRSCMKAVDAEAGLIFNFAAMPLTIKRVGREFGEHELIPGVPNNSS